MSDDTLRRAFAGVKPPVVVAALGPETFLREETLREVAKIHLGSADSPDLITIQPDEGVEPVIETAALPALGVQLQRDAVEHADRWGKAQVAAVVWDHRTGYNCASGSSDRHCQNPASEPSRRYRSRCQSP